MSNKVEVFTRKASCLTREAGLLDTTYFGIMVNNEFRNWRSSKQRGSKIPHRLWQAVGSLCWDSNALTTD